MIKLKSKEEIYLSAVMLCHIEGCNEEATKLFSTEINIIDVCDFHKQQLVNQSFIS